MSTSDSVHRPRPLATARSKPLGTEVAVGVFLLPLGFLLRAACMVFWRPAGDVDLWGVLPGLAVGAVVGSALVVVARARQGVDLRTVVVTVSAWSLGVASLAMPLSLVTNCLASGEGHDVVAQVTEVRSRAVEMVVLPGQPFAGATFRYGASRGSFDVGHTMVFTIHPGRLGVPWVTGPRTP